MIIETNCILGLVRPAYSAVWIEIRMELNIMKSIFGLIEV